MSEVERLVRRRSPSSASGHDPIGAALGPARCGQAAPPAALDERNAAASSVVVGALTSAGGFGDRLRDGGTEVGCEWRPSSKGLVDAELKDR